MLLRASCAVCDEPGAALCPACWSCLKPAPPCDPPDAVDACWSLLAYDGVARELIVGLKYRNARTILGRVGTALGRLIVGSDDERSTVGSIDVVTWAPTSGPRRRERGYDQAELLAHAIARHLRRPCRPLLVRRPGPAQTGRGRAERLVGPAFDAHPRIAAGVLVIDDVLTTGATMSAAAHALRETGCGPIFGATAARTMRQMVVPG